jgi:hypothetical protein
MIEVVWSQVGNGGVSGGDVYHVSSGWMNRVGR